MSIKNETKGRIITRKFRKCKSILSKTIGLMFSKKNKEALIFIFEKEKIIPLHMFFVFYSIDVLFLDKNKKVVEIKENFGPFRFYNAKNKAKYVIELPVGKIKKSIIDIGDTISFK